MSGHDRRTDPTDLGLGGLGLEGVQLDSLGLDLTAFDDAPADTDPVDLAATEALIERVAHGSADEQDAADPVAQLLVGLVTVIDADSARSTPDIAAMVESAERPGLDSVISLGRRASRRAGTMRHANVARTQPRTLRLAPLTSAAAAAAIVVAGALLVDDGSLTQQTPTTLGAMQNVGQAQDLLEEAYEAAARGDHDAAVRLVEEASRILRRLPMEQRVDLARQIRTVATRIGVTPPAIVLSPSLGLPSGGQAPLAPLPTPPDATLPVVVPTLPAVVDQSPVDDTASDTPSQTPSQTPTETPSDTSTQTPSDSPSESPSDTATPSPSQNQANGEESAAPDPQPSAQDSAPSVPQEESPAAQTDLGAVAPAVPQDGAVAPSGG